MTTNVSKILRGTKSLIQNRKRYHRLVNEKEDEDIVKQLPLISSCKVIVSTRNGRYDTTIDTNFSETGVTNSKHKIRLRSTFEIYKSFHNSNFFDTSPKLLFGLLKNSKVSFKSRFLQKDNDKDQISDSIYIPSTRVNLKKFSIQCNNSKTQKRFGYDFLDDERYNDLEYRECLIYGHREEIRKLLLERIDYFTVNKNTNPTTTLTKDVLINKLNFKLEFHSITVTFINNETQQKAFDIMLPLSLLPIFYYKGIQNFKNILAEVLEFNSTFDHVEANEDNLRARLKGQKKLKKSSTMAGLGLDSHFNCESKDEKDRFKFNLENLDAGNVTEHHIRNTKFPDKIQSHYYNVFKFSWITPAINYLVQVELPKVYFHETSHNIYITKYVDYDILFFMYKKMFLNWDFYLLNYLMSFTKCRRCIDRVYSKMPVSSNEQNVISLDRVKEHNYSMREHQMIFISTDSEGVNSTSLIKSMILKVTLTEQKDTELIEPRRRIYYVHFDFSEARRVVKTSDYFPLEICKGILMKLIEIKGLSLKFDYDMFNSVPESEWLRMIKDIKKTVSRIPPKKSKKASANNSMIIDNAVVPPVQVDIIGPVLFKQVFETRKDPHENGEFNIFEAFKSFADLDMHQWGTINAVKEILIKNEDEEEERKLRAREKRGRGTKFGSFLIKTNTSLVGKNVKPKKSVG